MKTFDLAGLIHPTPLDSFLKCNRSVHPLLVCRHDCKYFENLLGIEQIDELLTLGETYCTIDIQLEHASKTISNELFTHFDRSQNIKIKSRVDLDKLYDTFVNERAHIVIKDFSHAITSVNQLCGALSDSLNCDVATSIRISHKDSIQMPYEDNRNNIFILQLYGESVIDTCENAARGDIFSHGLRAGDFIYIPPGFRFANRNIDGASVQLLLVTPDLSWSRFVQFMIKEMSIQNGILRRSFKYGSLEGYDSPQALFQDIKIKIMNGLTFENLQRWSELHKSQRPRESNVNLFS